MRRAPALVGIGALLAAAGIFLPATEAKKSDKVGKVSGAELFRMNCSGCHGADRTGTKVAPKLTGISKKLNTKQLAKLLVTGRVNGGRVMPSFKHLDAAQREALVGFLCGTKGAAAKPLPPAKSPSALGARLFRSNCAACHETKPIKKARGPASLANVTRRRTRRQITNLIRNGVCSMPSFAHLSKTEVGGLYAFLKTLEQKNAPVQMGGCGGCWKVKKAMETDLPWDVTKKKQARATTKQASAKKAKQAVKPAAKKGCHDAKPAKNKAKPVKQAKPVKKAEPKGCGGGACGGGGCG